MTDTPHLSAVTTSRRSFLFGALGGGAVLGLGGVLAGCSSSSTDTSGGAPAGPPRKGGDLRVAILGGGSSDTLDAHHEVSQPDALRVMALYNGLVRLDSKAQVINDLAEELTPNADATLWTVRLKRGVTFHDGKPLTAADVIFTLRRIADPKSPGNGASALAPLDLAGIKAVDRLTVAIPMKTPYASFPEQISAAYNFGIVPQGYDPAKPVGTGPFKFDSFTPGQQSVFVRNDDYFGEGGPYLDNLTIIDSFESDTAAYNALQGGQVDAFAQATLSLAKSLNGGAGLRAVTSLPGQWTPLTMRVDQAPFNDPLVRQAFRLVVDRKQFIDVSLSGYGEVANDVFSHNDPAFLSSLQREQDLDQAKSLLKRAGRSDLRVELTTSDIAPGVLAGAQAFAQQAGEAGIDIKLNKVPVSTFYGPNYLSWSFAQDYWAYSPYLSQVAQGMLASSPFNETHWDNARYASLYEQANRTTDQAKQEQLVQDMMQIDFESGGYIIPSYNKQIDLVSAQVQGIEPAGTGLPMGNADWSRIWLAGS